MPQVKAHNSSNQFSINKFPEECPLCHFNIQPIYITGHRHNTVNGFYIQGVFMCVRQQCNKVFFADYYNQHGSTGTFNLSKVYPVQFVKKNFREEITLLSPNFTKIYNQAAAAESNDLTDICGPGYRKALEFLVKDYLIHKQPEQEAAIKEQFLGTCINNIPDANIKFCAERATWLGNDETHYIRKWESKDLDDLKQLIDLMLNWVTNELMMEKYRVEMAERR